MKRLHFLFLIFLGLMTRGLPQAFECDGSFFMSYSPSIFSNTKLIKAYYDDDDDRFRWTTVQEGDDRQIRPIGFRVVDNMIYGLDQNTLELLKINASGTVTVVGDLSNQLDTTYNYFAGDITPLGKYFVLVGRNKTSEEDEALFFVRLDRADLLTGRVSLISQKKTRLGDIASSPIYDGMYGYDSLEQRLTDIRWNTGLVTNFNYQTAPNLTAANALFTDTLGRLVAFGNSATSNPTDDTFYDINIFNGKAESISPGPRSRIVDGCSCPYTIKLEKKITPKEPVPCEDIKIIYTIKNKAGTSYRDISLKDSLPDEFIIVNIENAPANATIHSGIGSNFFHMTYLDLLLGTDSIILTAQIDPQAQGQLGSRGWLETLPLAFGEKVYSTNPDKDSLSGNETTIKIGSSLSLGPDLTLCDDEPVILGQDLPNDLEGISFLWNTGSTESTISTNQRGWYWVDIELNCKTFRDSIFIEKPPFFSTVDAGEDQSIIQGQSVTINGSAQSPGDYTLQWFPQPELAMSCDDCLEPTSEPLDSTLYNVLLTDEYGCVAFDEAWVYVDKQRDIFIPNVFSPNNDGINDIFFISGTSIATIKRFQIFDRWGKKAFSSPEVPINSREYGWDGRMGNKPAFAGVYYYAAELEFPDQTIEVYKGSITLLR